MFIFLRLLLAHLIGDFPLQFNKVHALKYKGLTGLLPHILIVFGCYIILCAPLLDRLETWEFLMFVVITHLLQDWAKIKFTKNTQHTFLFYLIDQVLHLLVLLAVFLTGLISIQPVRGHESAIMSLYNNDTFILVFIVIIAAAYNGHYMLLLIKKDHFRIERVYSTFERRYGMIERSIIALLLYPGLFMAWAGIVIPLFRPLLFNLGKNGAPRLKSWFHFINPTSGGVSIHPFPDKGESFGCAQDPSNRSYPEQGEGHPPKQKTIFAFIPAKKLWQGFLRRVDKLMLDKEFASLSEMALSGLIALASGTLFLLKG